MPTIKALLLDLFDRSATSAKLHNYLITLLLTMANAKTAKKASQARYEFQGALNTLMFQGTLTAAGLDQLNEAITDYWTPFARQWVIDELADNTQQPEPGKPEWARYKGELHNRPVWSDGVDYAYLDAPEEKIKLDRAEMHQMRIND